MSNVGTLGKAVEPYTYSRFGAEELYQRMKPKTTAPQLPPQIFADTMGY